MGTHKGLFWAPDQPCVAVQWTCLCGRSIWHGLKHRSHKKLHACSSLQWEGLRNYMHVVLFTLHSSIQLRETVFPEGYQRKNYTRVVLSYEGHQELHMCSSRPRDLLYDCTTELRGPWEWGDPPATYPTGRCPMTPPLSTQVALRWPGDSKGLSGVPMKAR